MSSVIRSHNQTFFMYRFIRFPLLRPVARPLAKLFAGSAIMLALRPQFT